MTGKDGDDPMGKSTGKDGDTAAGASVINMSSRRPPSRKGIPATAKQKAALAKGTESRRAASKAAKAKQAKDGNKKPKSRWRQLLAGDITVEDLDTEELQKMQTRNSIGSFTTSNASVPAKLARDMKAELLRRGQAILDSAYTDAVTLLQDVVKDKRARTPDRIKAAQLIVERSAGRMPETVRVEKSATWDETFEDGVVVVSDGERTG